MTCCNRNYTIEFGIQKTCLVVIHRNVELAGPERVDIDVGEALVVARELVHGAGLPPELIVLVPGRADPFVSESESFPGKTIDDMAVGGEEKLVGGVRLVPLRWRPRFRYSAGTFKEAAVGSLTRGQWPNRRAASESTEVKSGLRF